MSSGHGINGTASSTIPFRGFCSAGICPECGAARSVENGTSDAGAASPFGTQVDSSSDAQVPTIVGICGQAANPSHACTRSIEVHNQLNLEHCAVVMDVWAVSGT